ncbi:hypothetical protein ABPG74_008334 [Tetrahymena malaccensis]
MQQQNQSIIVAFGTTGCGKSTILNYLLKKELCIRNKKFEVCLDCDDTDSFQIGHTNQSQTEDIQIKSKDQIKFADFPGLSDTRGLNVRIQNFNQFIEFFSSNQRIKLLIIEEFSTLLDQRGSEFPKRLDRLNNIFGSLNNIQDSAIFIFNKYAGGAVSEKLLKDILEHINGLLQTHQSEQYCDFFNHLFKENRVFLFSKPNQSEVNQIIRFNLREQIINQINNLRDLQINNQFILYQCLDSQSQIELKNQKDTLMNSILTIDKKMANLFYEVLLQSKNYTWLSYFQDENNIGNCKSALRNKFQFIFESPEIRTLNQKLNSQIKELKRIFQFVPVQENDKFCLQKITHFKQQIDCFTYIYAEQLQGNTFLIIGNIVMSKAVQNYINLNQQCDFVVVAKHKFILDSDISHYGRSIYIKSKKFVCQGERKISVQGLKGVENTQINDITLDGLPGLPGENGGTVIIDLQEDFHFDTQQSQLIIDVTGGEGGDGQNGQNGLNGASGEDANIQDFLSKQPQYLAERERITSKTKEFLTFNSVFEEFYFVSGKYGQRGSDGGKGGHAGIQGNHGFAYIIINEMQKDESNINEKVQIQKNLKNAQHGAGGLPGRGGKRGNHIVGVYKEEYMFPTLRRIKNINNHKQDNKYVRSGSQFLAASNAGIGVTGTAARVLGLVSSTGLKFLTGIAGIAGLAITGAQIVGSVLSAQTNSNWDQRQQPTYIDSQEYAESGQQINDEKNDIGIQQPKRIQQINLEQRIQEVQELFNNKNSDQFNTIIYQIQDD